MTFFKQFEHMNIRYVHCGDDFWRPFDQNGTLEWNRRFVNQPAIIRWIETVQTTDDFPSHMEREPLG